MISHYSSFCYYRVGYHISLRKLRTKLLVINNDCFIPSVIISQRWNNSSKTTIPNHKISDKAYINLDSSCPYTLLNVPRNSDHTIVKRAFLHAAIVYHPDKVEYGNASIFIRLREAFEKIILTNNNNSNDDSIIYDNNNDSDFEQWLQTELNSNDFLAFQMDEKTRQEVIDVHKTVLRSGNDRGGYWEMARQIAERDETHKRLSSISSKNESLSGLLSSGISTPSSNNHNIGRRKKR